MYYTKNAAINDDDKDRMLNDVNNNAAFLNDGNDNDNDNNNLNANNDMDNDEDSSDDRK